MPVTNWWTVDDALQQITGGPFLWDGVSDWTPPAGQRATSTNPAGSGYTWPSGAMSPAAMTAFDNRLSSLEQRIFTEARGVKVLPAVTLILGGTTTVRVTLKSQMPTTNYTPWADLMGGAQVGSLSIQSVTVVDRQNVDVVVKAAVALTITGVALLVFADAN